MNRDDGNSGLSAPLQAEAAPSTTSSAETTVAPNSAAAHPSRLDSAIYVCLLLFAGALVHSKAITEIAYGAAMLLWVVKLVIKRERPWRQPLAVPLLLFLLLSTISTVLSLEPALSWDRMKSVGLLIVCVLFAQNVRTLRQVRTLIAVVLVSTLFSIGYNAWLYVDGIGAKVTTVAPGSILNSVGVLPGDLIVAVNGHRTHSVGTFRRALNRADSTRPVRLQLERSEDLFKIQVQLSRDALLNSGIMQPGVLSLGRPVRAQGSLGYVVTYAEVLLQITLLTWGLLLAANFGRRGWKWPLFLAFVLMCATLGATLTRASLLSCFAAGMIAFWICVPRAMARFTSIVFVALALLAVSLLVRHQRKLGMIALSDPGTEYRVLMWEDGVRLAEQHPFFGVGMDTIKARFRQLNIRAYLRFTLHSHFHSTPIQLAAERGLLTLGAWIWLMFVYLKLLWRLLKRVPSHDWSSRGTVLGILVATIGFLTSSLVQYNLGDSEVQLLFWFLMGLAIVLNRLFPPGQEKQSQPA